MKNILSLLPRIGLTILGVMIAALVVFMAYIMMAPNDWPKPFQLVYASASNDQQQTSGENSSGKVSAPAEPALLTEAPPAATVEIRPGQGIMMDTGSKIVNLVDPSGRKYLRVGLTLELAPTDLKYYTMTPVEKEAFKKTFEEDLTAKMPIVNDIIITLLSSQTFETVYTAQGKEDLRKQLMTTINKQLPEYRVIFVYFTEFVVQ